MGNCCASKHGQQPYQIGQNTLKPNHIRKKGDNQARESFDDVMQADDEKTREAGGRGHTLNRLTMLDQKDVSNANSLLASTLIQDASQSQGGSYLVQDGKEKSSKKVRQLSLLSDGGINPDEMDENIGRSSINRRKDGNQPAITCDLTVPPEPKRQIYKITNEFPVQRPYSMPQEWQKILVRHSIQQQTVINDKPVEPQDDALAENILNLSNRNWIRDQIQMHIENQSVMQDSLDSLVKQKKSIQLREHFSWFVWAVAQYYFGAPGRAPQQQFEEVDSNTSNIFHSRATIPDQDVSIDESDSTIQYQNTSQASIYGARMSVGVQEKPVVTKKNNQSAQHQKITQSTKKPTVFTNCKLPRTTSPQWSEGFNYKGVFFKLIPYEDATYVLEEMKALKYAQVELLDLQNYEQNLINSQNDYTQRNTNTSKTKGVTSKDRNAEFDPKPQSQLHKEVILPFLVGIKSCGFYLYGTPLIYTQEVMESARLRQNSYKYGQQLKTENPFSIDNLCDLVDESYEEFTLPKFSSCIPDTLDFDDFKGRVRQGSFAYLHDNIDENTLKDPMLERMPILKNVSQKNLIPVIDFEEFNNISKRVGNSSSIVGANGQTLNMTINYFMVYLSGTLRSLSQESASSALFTLPNLNNDEMQFYPFPTDKKLDYLDLKSMIFQQAGSGAGSGSIKPLGDNSSMSPKNKQDMFRQNLSKSSNEDPKTIEKLFNRKFSIKHGWKSFIIERSQMTQSNLSTANGLAQNTRPFENRRATTFFSLRENTSEAAETAPKSDNGQLKTPQFHHILTGDKKTGGKENIEESPRGHQAQQQKQQPHFVTPKKKTILKRRDNTKEDVIFGNCVVSAVYTKGFKVKFSMTQHSYANGIETMFQLSLDQIAKVLDCSDRVSNISSLKALMHRKGLNLRFLWILLTKVKLQFTRDLIMVSILVRTMRRIIHEEVKIRSTKRLGGTQLGSSLYPTQLSQSRQFGKSGSHASPRMPHEHYLGNQQKVFKECIVLFVNAIMKNKFSKYKQVFDETLLGLFLSRLKIISLAHQLDLPQHEINYLESKDLIENIIEMPSRNPILFLNSVQEYFNLQYQRDFIRLYRQDKYYILNKSQPMSTHDFKENGVLMKVDSYFSLKEHAYYILARKIAFNSRLRKQRDSQGMRNSRPSIAKMFARPRDSNDYIDTERSQHTDRDIETYRTKTQFSHSNSKRQGSGVTIKPNNQETHRNFHNIGSSHNTHTINLNASVKSDGTSIFKQNNSSSFSNIIDLSKIGKRDGFKMKDCGEILLPSSLYKLHTCSQTFKQNQSNTIYQPYYDMPNVDVINEWVIVLESLLQDVHSVQGCEQVLLEALIYQFMMTFFLEQDPDSAQKILFKVRDLLHEAQICSPELIMMCMTLTGLFCDGSEELDQFPIESEKNYLLAMVLAFQIFGDPRGRGNYSVPYFLFYSWKLSLLSLADGKKIVDSELAEELFDSSLSSLFNHKRFYKAQHIELMAAQEQAHSSNAGNNLNNSLNQSYNKQKSSQNLYFELAQEQQELRNNHFNVKKYRKRPTNVMAAGGFVKVGTPTSSAKNETRNQMSIVTNKMSEKDSNPAGQSKQKSQMGLNAHPSIASQANFSKGVARLDSARESSRYMQNHQMENSLNMLQKSNYDAEISDIDLEFKVEEDEDKSKLVEINFKDGEGFVGKSPFPHWTINRQMYQSQMNSLQQEKNQRAAKQLHKENIRDQITKSLDNETLFSWMINYNPMMTACGLMWDSKTIKEVVFYQNQQIVSDSSSVAFSNMKGSQYSYRSSTDQMQTRRRKQHFGPYSQFLGKEVGGISKGEILGLLYTWGTDQFGQLGLENFVTGKQLGSLQSLKVLHPRLLVPLKDELIKEIVCGYSHTLAINQFGQMYSWGNNENGQLGLGQDNVPNVVRKPILNQFVSKVIKLAAGHEHSLALTKNQELYVWGSGALTGLGDSLKNNAETGECENVYYPTQLEFFKTHKIVHVACGGLHTIVLNQEGNLYSWGSTEGGQLGISGEIREETILSPQLIDSLANILTEKKQKIVQVSCGEAHSVILTDLGEVWGWGMSMYGQLGLGFSGDSFEPGLGMSMSKVAEPTEITQFLPTDVTVNKIVCGAAFTLFLTTENELYGCGINDLGQLGLDTYLEEMQIAVIDRARQAAGANGVRNVVTSDVTVPSRVICFEGLRVNTVACGENHSLALIGEEKSMWAWGMYRNGQLGLGEVNQKMNPRPVQALHNTNIHRLAAGSQHSLALLGDSNQLAAMALSFYPSDLLTNPWVIDIRRLSGNYYNESPRHIPQCSPKKGMRSTVKQR